MADRGEHCSIIRFIYQAVFELEKHVSQHLEVSLSQLPNVELTATLPLIKTFPTKNSSEVL